MLEHRHCPSQAKISHDIELNLLQWNFNNQNNLSNLTRSNYCMQYTMRILPIKTFHLFLFCYFIFKITLFFYTEIIRNILISLSEE